MIEFIRKRWVLFLVLIVFIACKIPHLFYPYYWDESWPYAVAIKEMHRHGVSLMPSAVSPEISRGHPLFFHAIAAIWMHIFGPSHVSMHSFALCISLVFLILIYEAGLDLFNKRVAIMSLILVASQMAFFTQASFVLFEILVALLVFASIYFYVKDKYLLTALSLTMLFYTKESGLIAGFVLGIAAFIGLFNKNDTWRTRLLRLTSICIPCVLIGVFFLIQKHVRGWYIFPFYNNLIEHKWDSFWVTFRTCPLHVTFIRQSRYWDFILLLIISVIAAVKNKNIKYLGILLPATLIYYFVDDRRAEKLASLPFFILFIISIVLFLYALKQLKKFHNPRQEKLIVLCTAFIFCFMCFSAMNYFLDRYVLATIVPALFLSAVLFDSFIARSYPALFYPVLFIILTIGGYAFYTNTNYGDCEPGAFEAMDVEQHAINYMVKNNYRNKSIGAAFLIMEHMTDPNSGFLDSDKVFTNVRWEMNNNTDFIIFDNIEVDHQRYNAVSKNTGFYLAYRYQKDSVWTEIYAKK